MLTPAWRPSRRTLLLQLAARRSCPLRRVLLALIAVGAATLGGVQSSQGQSANTAAGRSVLAVAGPAMREILSRNGTPRDRGRLLKNNLSRYFAAYPINMSGADGQRIVGTVERMSRAFTAALYGEASAAAQASGEAEISLAQVEQAITHRLPSRDTGHRSRAFFPAAGEGATVVIEQADFEAFAATGLSWNSLGDLVVKVLEVDPAALPLSAAAVRRLASAVDSYALLVLRLGGRHAAAARAPYLLSRHLRLAAKTIAARAKGEAAAIEIPPRRLLEPAARPLFVEVSAEAGFAFTHVTSEWLSRFRRFGPPAPSFSGGGVTAGDMDGDGWPDLIVCGGEGCALFRNRGDDHSKDRHFEEITAASGIHWPGEARMAVLADFDNDGRRDLFLTYARDANRLYKNLGGGRFKDVTGASGLGRQGDISGPAVAFDYDNDGRLDLYVGNFGNYLAEATPWESTDARNAMPNRLYRNLGELRFADVTEKAGVGNTGWSQALSHADLDLDGDQDLYLANDFGRNELFLNQGDGTFASSGAGSGADDPFHGMNIAFAELNGDGLPDLFVTNIWHWQPARKEVDEFNSLLTSQRREDNTVRYDRAPAPGQFEIDTGWSWAGLFFDADLDGDDDLFVTGGLTDYSTFVQYRPHPDFPGRIYPINDSGEPNLFLRNDDGLPSHPITSGAELAGRNSRSLALLDYDLDGDLDLAITTFHSQAHLFRNDAPPRGHHWLAVQLVGDAAQGVNRDAIGSQIVASTAEGFSAWRSVTGGEGYLGMSSLPVEFGLGKLSEVDLEVRWPNGTVQRLTKVPANRRVRVTYGQEGYELLPQLGPAPAASAEPVAQP